jgi:hypothetical protein
MTNPLSDLLRVIESATPGPWTTAIESGDEFLVNSEYEFINLNSENLLFITTFNPQLVRALVEECMAAREAFYMCRVDDYYNYDTARGATDKLLEVDDE